MASIPTNAFSAPRVRWVMQQKLREEQEKKSQEDKMSRLGVDQLKDMNRTRRASDNSLGSGGGSSSFSSSENLDMGIGEAALRPVFQRMHSSTLMVPIQRYLPSILPRPDFGRSISHTESRINDGSLNGQDTMATANKLAKHRRSAMH